MQASAGGSRLPSNQWVDSIQQKKAEYSDSVHVWEVTNIAANMAAVLTQSTMLQFLAIL